MLTGGVCSCVHRFTHATRFSSSVYGVLGALGPMVGFTFIQALYRVWEIICPLERIWHSVRLLYLLALYSSKGIYFGV